MIDVRSRRCAAPDCKRQPSYGFEGKRACFCAAHKAQGMVDVVSRRCEEPNCRRRPLYGYEVSSGQGVRGRGGGRGEGEEDERRLVVGWWVVVCTPRRLYAKY